MKNKLGKNVWNELLKFEIKLSVLKVEIGRPIFFIYHSKPFFYKNKIERQKKTNRENVLVYFSIKD